jgi:hypothetical protein
MNTFVDVLCDVMYALQTCPATGAGSALDAALLLWTWFGSSQLGPRESGVWVYTANRSVPCNSVNVYVHTTRVHVS